MATKLLLVEDSLSIQTIVETTFTREGFEVMVVSDALDGLHKVQTLLPDIVLADASMPGMDGFQLCQSIRQSASGRHVPVVLLTSGFAAYDKAKGERVGVTTHLAKPFEPQVLLDMVKQLVAVVHRPLYSPSTVATILPRLEGNAFEASGADAWEHVESDARTAARLSMERVEAAAVTRSAGSERAVDLVGDTWSDVTLTPPPPEVPHPAETSRRAGDGISPAVTQTPQDASSGAASETVSLDALYPMLGRHMVQILREALDVHLTTALAQLMPQMLDTVRDVVHAQMPVLLEGLLQQEIDKLKRAVEQDQGDA
jgi:DNA-binding response OmpR family regulator